MASFGIDKNLLSYVVLAQVGSASNITEGLARLALPIAQKFSGEKFNSQIFCTELKEMLGIEIHVWAVEGLLDEFERAGIIFKSKASEATDVLQYFYCQNINENQSISVTEIRAVLIALKKFSESTVFSDLSDEELADLFYQRIVTAEFLSMLSRSVSSNSNNKTNGNKNILSLKRASNNSENEESAILIERKHDEDTLCAGFILNLKNENNDLFEIVRKMAAGALLSEFVLNLKRPENNQKLNGMTVILDTTLLMQYLGLNSVESKNFARSMCEKLVSKGASLAAFSHTVEEMVGNLSAVLAVKDSGSIPWGETAPRLHDAVFESYVREVRRNPEIALKNNSIRVLNPITDQYQYFSGDTEESLKSRLNFLAYQARERDASSIASVVRLNQHINLPMTKFHQCRFIFLTTNKRLASFSKRFFEENKLQHSESMPVIISQNTMSSLLFVMYGEECQDIPRELLIANCSRSLSGNFQVVEKVCSMLNGVSPEQADLFKAVMTTERAGHYLMRATLGNPSAVSEQNIHEILEYVQSSQSEKERAQYNELLSQKETEYQGSISTLQGILDSKDSQIKTEKEEKYLFAEKLNEQDKALDTIKKETVRSLNCRYGKAFKLALSIYEKTRKIIFAIIFVSSLFGLLWGVFHTHEYPWYEATAYIIVSILVSMLLIPKISNFFNISIARWLAEKTMNFFISEEDEKYRSCFKYSYEKGEILQHIKTEDYERINKDL